MTLGDTLAVALTAIRANTLRSLLTTLGIIIGVASVIVMVAIGNGARQDVDRQIARLGANMLVVWAGSAGQGGRRGGGGTATPFQENDLDVLSWSLPGIEAIAGTVSGQSPIVYGAKNWGTSVEGSHARYAHVRDWELAEGRWFTEQEVRQSARVAVLGATVVREVFGEEPPVGTTIRVGATPFEVIGVLRELGQSSYGRDQDDRIMVPITTARSRVFGRDPATPDKVEQIYVKGANAVNLSELADGIREVLRKQRRILPGQDDNFNVRDLADLVRARTATLTTLSWLLASTAAISLVVGGIGIMNIMLVSVTERTREIGVRMAVGARPAAILGQFLVEAVVLCLFGGLAGVALGVLGTVAAARLAQWPVLIDPLTVLGALAAAGAVGLFFGWFPARRAARLDPIVALRHE